MGFVQIMLPDGTVCVSREQLRRWGCRQKTMVEPGVVEQVKKNMCAPHHALQAAAGILMQLRVLRFIRDMMQKVKGCLHMLVKPIVCMLAWASHPVETARQGRPLSTWPVMYRSLLVWRGAPLRLLESCACTQSRHLNPGHQFKAAIGDTDTVSRHALADDNPVFFISCSCSCCRGWRSSGC